MTTSGGVTTHWRCLAATLPPTLATACTEGGTYVHTAKTGDSGPAWKHLVATNHPVLTTTSAPFAARLTGAAA